MSIMAHRFGNRDAGEESSDQEDLVDASGGSELDDEVTDMDEMQFAYCKTDAPFLNPVDPVGENSSTRTTTTKIETKVKLIMLGVGLLLLISTFILLFLHPLYMKQLELGGSDKFNAFGSLFFISTIVTALLVCATATCNWLFKWKLRTFQLPIPAKGLCIISTCCGLAGTFCAIGSYKRVPCHLQDPLKGAALVYSLVFYFFFCRKVMGLQRIFSATTAVVGLFISVDYGLCDEFRCRGKDIVTADTKVTTGWQDRAVWTLMYVIGIALWTLHLSLLEGYVVTLPGSIMQNLPPINLLSTVSRIVSRNEPLLQEPEPAKPVKKFKPKALHLCTWIHVISFAYVLLLGWIDVIPRSEQTHRNTKAPPSFWSSTGSTLLCHVNLLPVQYDPRLHQQTLDYLSNMTPHSALYNETVLRLRRRQKRSAADSSDFINHAKSINNPTKNVEESTTTAPNLHAVNATQNANKTHHHDASSSHHTKINTEKHWRIMKNKIRQKIKFIDSHNQPITPLFKHGSTESVLPPDITPNCHRVSNYAWLFIMTYIVFAISLFTFLILSESTVFTVTIITSALPLIGIFWSLFELRTAGNTAFIAFSPEVTGELICSLLGTPIVFLGLGLLCRAHFRDGSSSIPHQRLYNTLS
ncbi:uncharacterized protein LOC134837606 [Culicoides brevitarsis]|uniref:uncharacterized protein LOC134837606 n=1 Tax=Culicoides brevitarsis TaxID=469753 RepID=UPI00307BE916